MLESSLIKVAIAGGAIALVPFTAKRHGLTKQEFLGGGRPPLWESTLWIALYVAWMLGTNALMNWRGPWDFAPWRAASLLDDALRVAAVGLLGPIAEELIFRGYLYARLLKTRLPVPAVIGLLALSWALLHWSYPPGVIAIIFVSGLMLGMARLRTGTVFVPALMHVIWNLYAVW